MVTNGTIKSTRFSLCASARIANTWSSQFKNNYFTEMCSGSEEGSYLRLIATKGTINSTRFSLCASARIANTWKIHPECRVDVACGFGLNQGTINSTRFSLCASARIANTWTANTRNLLKRF